MISSNEPLLQQLMTIVDDLRETASDSDLHYTVYELASCVSQIVANLAKTTKTSNKPQLNQ